MSTLTAYRKVMRGLVPCPVDWQRGKGRELGGRIVRTALHALTAPVSGPTLFEPLAAAPAPVGP